MQNCTSTYLDNPGQEADRRRVPLVNRIKPSYPGAKL